MLCFNRLVAILTAAALLAPLDMPLAARTKKGDKLITQGREREARRDYDGALDLYEQALNLDPSDPGYQLAADRVRFQASQAHLKRGVELRKQGALSQALVELQKAYGIDPASSIAEQEVRLTLQMIDREKRRAQEAAPSAPPRSAEERAMTPAQEARKEAQGQIARILPVPELRPLNSQPINLKMNNQSPRVLFETVGKLAGINVLFDPDYTPVKNQSIEINNSTLEQGLDYLSVITKSFWKPLSVNTIFVTNDNTTKRRDYEEQVMKVFYLNNVNTPQELQEIVTAVRSVADIQRLFVYNAQNAIIARGEADRIALAEKIISDLDKPKPEVLVDVVVMEINTDYIRNLAAALAPNGITMPISFSPRNSLLGSSILSTTGSTGTTTTGTTGTTTTGTTGTTGTTTTTGTTGTTTTGTTGTSSSGTPIPLANIGKINFSDYSVVLPNGMLQAMMSDSGTRILQAPQLRAVDNFKATLKIGEKRPTATGSFQPGIGGVGINPLVNTQFTFIDVGVNVEIMPRVHEDGEVSLHVDVEISKVDNTINLGGIDQPVIGQRKVTEDIRLKGGEVNLIGGLVQVQQTKSVTGVPGLSSIPILRRLFTSEDIENSTTELVIALIPHVMRRMDVNRENLRTIAVGNATTVKLNYGPEKATGTPTVAAPAPAAGAPAAAAPAATAPTPPATAPAPPPAPASVQPSPSARFLPAQLDATVGNTVTTTVMLDHVKDLFSAPMHIKFDPKLLRLNDVAQGNLLSSDGQQVVFTKNVLNDSGEATVTLNRMPGASGVSGAGTAVTLTFQAVARGAATVSVPQFAPRDSKGQTLLTASPVLTINIK